MKITWFRTLIKIWIALTSLAAFLAGWILLGHSGKPVSASAASQPAQIAPLPTLAPIAPLDSNSTGLQPMPAQQPSFQFLPRMRTMGS